MDQVEEGDIIFSYVRQQIRKIAIAQSKAFTADKPDDNSFGEWSKKGRQIDVKYHLVPQPITNKNLQHDFGTELMGKGRERPLTAKGGGKQLYFGKIIPSVGQKLLEQLGVNNERLGGLVDETLAASGESETTRNRIAKSRIGQGKFRNDLLQDWDKG